MSDFFAPPLVRPIPFDEFPPDTEMPDPPRQSHGNASRGDSAGLPENECRNARRIGGIARCGWGDLLRAEHRAGQLLTPLTTLVADSPELDGSAVFGVSVLPGAV